MNAEHSRRVVIDIVHATDTVTGRLAVGDGPATEFFGWIELIDRLQSAAGSPAPAAVMAQHPRGADSSVEDATRGRGASGQSDNPLTGG